MGVQIGAATSVPKPVQYMTSVPPTHQKRRFFSKLWSGIKKIAKTVVKVVLPVVGFAYGLAHPFLGTLAVYGASKGAKLPGILGDAFKNLSVGIGSGLAVGLYRSLANMRKKPVAAASWIAAAVGGPGAWLGWLIGFRN